MIVPRSISKTGTLFSLIGFSALPFPLLPDFALLMFVLIPDRVVVASCSHLNRVAVSVSEILVFQDRDCISFHLREVISVLSFAGLAFTECKTFLLLLRQLLCARHRVELEAGSPT